MNCLMSKFKCECACFLHTPPQGKTNKQTPLVDLSRNISTEVNSFFTNMFTSFPELLTFLHGCLHRCQPRPI